MKQTARIISTYAGDTSGVCSALFELGGMTVMHDASGCNSTYNTHDEPRWYDRDSLVFISGLSETEAILGDDRKLVDDCIQAARELHPRFIAIAGSPIPMMTGFDYDAAARQIEAETGICAFAFPTSGMHSYTEGAGMALKAIAGRLCREDVTPSPDHSCNLLGLTPLDFSIGGTAESIREAVEAAGFRVIASWAMGSMLDELCLAGSARVNLVVSSVGLPAARELQRRFGTPYVVGTPCGNAFTCRLLEAMRASAEDGEPRICRPAAGRFDGTVLIGEAVTALSLAAALQAEYGKTCRVLSAAGGGETLTGEAFYEATDEDEILPLLRDADTVIADPLYAPIVPEHARLIPLPHEGFSGRIYRKQIPNLVLRLDSIGKELTL